jgi:mitogen-activated protein kinase organizer 1
MAFPSTLLARLEGSFSPIHALCYSASPGTYILSGSGDRTIRLYNPFPATEGLRRGEVRPGKLIQKFEAHGYEVLDLDVSRCVLLSFPSIL